jgi:F-type H+-transporting ATPase subunit gamma
MSLKTIKTKIIATKKTAKVTRAMEAVSAVKMRKAQQRALTGRGYARAAVRVLTQVSGDLFTSKHPLATRPAQGTSGEKKIGVVIITSDKGLAGSLNSAVLKQVSKLATGEDVLGSKVVAFCIGRRGYEYAIRRGFDVRYSDVNVSDTVSTEQFDAVTAQALQMFTEGEVRELFVVYTNFKSTFEQQATTRSLLPFSEATLREFVEGILPEKGALAVVHDPHKKTSVEQGYSIEPDKETVYAELLPNLFKITLYYALSESKASEHSARMVAMKAATDNAKKMASTLTLLFNRKRQASITAEVSEITSGIEAMAV